MAHSLPCIPRCAVNVLFAEDLIHHFMSRRTGLEFKASRAAPYRGFIFNAFNDVIGEAVDFIDTILEWELDETFSTMVDEHRVNAESFIDYALHFEERFFGQGFDADNFLNFCARLVGLAAYFVQHGEPVATELALFAIMEVMSKYDLFEGGWDTLNTVAKKYVERRDDYCNVLTPDVSDDEPSMNDQEDDDDEYYLIEEGGFDMKEEEKPKDELDRQRLDPSGSDLTACCENEAEGYMTIGDDESAIAQEGKPQDKPDRERMDLPGSKFDLPAISEKKSESYILDCDDESAIAQEGKPQDKADLKRMDLPGSKLDLTATYEKKAESYISVGDYESTIALEGKPQDKPDCERMDLSGSKPDSPACPESKDKIKTVAHIPHV